MNFRLKSWQPYSWTDVPGGLFHLDCDLEAVWVEVNTGDEYKFHFIRGLVWDGASVPRIFRWYLPNVDKENLVYTLAGLVHDACYGSGCVTREIADDLFRGTMRDAGIPRRKASFAEWLVGLFGKSHYGVEHDTRGIRFYCHVDYRPGRGNAVQR